MKHHHSRREFIRKTAQIAGAAATLPLLPTFAADTNAPTAAPPDGPVRVLPPAPKPIAAPPNFGVAFGPFKPSWESLSSYQTPDWFRDAKFGIWAH